MDISWLSRRAKLTSVMITVSALALAACSTVGGDSAATAAACDSPGVTADLVTLGLVFPDTGSLSQPLTGIRGGIDARVGVANHAGGVHGRTVNVEWRDDESLEATNLKVSHELLDQVGVLGMIQASAVVTEAAPYLNDNGVPVVGLGIEPVWSEYANMFPVFKTYSDGPTETTFGKYVTRAGGTRAMVIVDPRDEAAQSVARSLTESLRSQNVEIVSEVPFAPDVNAPDRVAAAMVEQGIDTLIGAVNAAIFASILGAAKAHDVPLRAVLALAGYDQRMVDAFTTTISGMTIYVPYEPFEQSTPALDTYRSAMSTYAPQVGNPNRQASILAYIAADLMLAGLEAAGDCPTREGIVDAMHALTNYTAGGLLATPLALGEGAPQQAPCYYFVQVNPAGNGFDVVPGGDGPERDMWCGERLPD